MRCRIGQTAIRSARTASAEVGLDLYADLGRLESDGQGTAVAPGGDSVPKLNQGRTAVSTRGLQDCELQRKGVGGGRVRSGLRAFAAGSGAATGHPTAELRGAAAARACGEGFSNGAALVFRCVSSSHAPQVRLRLMTILRDRPEFVAAGTLSPIHRRLVNRLQMRFQFARNLARVSNLFVTKSGQIEWRIVPFPGIVLCRFGRLK